MITGRGPYYWVPGLFDLDAIGVPGCFGKVAMTFYEKFRTGSFGLTVLVLISILSLSTLVRAGEPCLIIAMPEVRMTGDGIEPYRSAMQQGGLCVKPVRMPLARVAQALSHGEIDGVFAELEGFQQNVDRPILRGNIRVGLVDGMLVVPLGKISGIDDLKDETVGVWLGAKWSNALLADYPNVVHVPRGPEMMQKMLRYGRLDAILLDNYSLSVTGGVPDGFQAVPVMSLSVYSWLAADHADLLPAFDKGTELFLQTIIEWRQKGK